jgi:2-polyprenyl-3-methyl-5-hydroxy-6-metoxy-1,4-benzoquinol methylase
MKQPEHLVWTPEMVKNFWDYESQFPEQYFTYQRSTEMVRQISTFLAPGSRILDYGCGPGYLIDKLMQRGFEAAGLAGKIHSETVFSRRLYPAGTHGGRHAFRCRNRH